MSSATGLDDFTGVAAYLPAQRRRGDAVESTTFAIREAILEGDLPGGTWLREESIAGVLGMSRTPVREAFNRLVEEGLVERLPGSGVRVSALTVDDVAVVYQVRGSLESLAVGIAARRGDPAVHQRLRSLQETMVRAAEADDAAEFHHANMAFHAAFAEIGDNNYLRRLLGTVYTAVRRIGTRTFSAERMREILAEHELIIDAVIAGDPEAASAAAQAHAERARSITLARLLA
jgi:DNA-binding GntR family transcriptional regulator